MNKFFSKKLIIFYCLALILLLGHYYYLNDISNNGKAYPSKQILCQHFAQSYLKTIQKTENIKDFGSEKWRTAINIETDLYKLCLVDLNKKVGNK